MRKGQDIDAYKRFTGQRNVQYSDRDKPCGPLTNGRDGIRDKPCGPLSAYSSINGLLQGRGGNKSARLTEINGRF